MRLCCTGNSDSKIVDGGGRRNVIMRNKLLLQGSVAVPIWLLQLKIAGRRNVPMRTQNVATRLCFDGRSVAKMRSSNVATSHKNVTISLWCPPPSAAKIEIAGVQECDYKSTKT